MNFSELHQMVVILNASGDVVHCAHCYWTTLLHRLWDGAQRDGLYIGETFSWFQLGFRHLVNLSCGPTCNVDHSRYSIDGILCGIDHQRPSPCIS